MKALVTGASGFIGSHLIEKLNGLGWEARALMRASSSAANLGDAKFMRVAGDLADAESLRAAVQGVDVVFHLAGATSAPSREAYFEHNARGTERLVQAAAEANPGLRRFVYVSSLAAGGPAPGPSPRSEDEAPAPVSAYGESKLGGERAVLALRDRLPVAIVRPPMVYGPKDKGVFALIQTVNRGLMPMLRGRTPDGAKHYSTVHVDDLCEGILKVAQAGADQVRSGDIFYVCSDETSTYGEILGTAARVLGRRPFRIQVPTAVVRGLAEAFTRVGGWTGKTFPLNRDKLNELLPDFWTCSNRKARETLGFRPRYDLSSGMEQSIAWYKEHGWL